MKTECGKIPYETRDLAVAALAHSRDRFKKAKNTSWRRLHIYQCDVCEGKPFHLGRSFHRPLETEESLQKQSTAKLPRPVPVKKIPSQGELRRRLKRIDKKLDGERMHLAFQLGQRIAADRQRDYEMALAAIGYPENVAETGNTGER